MKKYLRRFWPLYLLMSLAVTAVAVGGSRAVTAVAENMPIVRRSIIVIDAGHGGEDGGAVSCTGALESHINLQVAVRLDALLHLLGYETLLIRSTDTSVHTEGTTVAARKASDLRQRVRTVNQTENALLISIHQNLFADSRYSGAQVFFNSQPGSRELAQSVQAAMIAALNPQSNRRIKQSQGIYLMQYINKPGILVECGFLSNPEEEAKLRAGEYQKKICCVIASSVAQFLNGT